MTAGTGDPDRPAVPGWEPANDAERLLLAALADGAQERYFQVLQVAQLYLPGYAGERGTGRQRLVTWRLAGVPHLVAFTSVPALSSWPGLAASGADAFLLTSVAELVARWPDPAWRLAVDPHLPLCAAVPVTAIGALAAGRTRLPTVAELAAGAVPPTVPPVRPANETEQRLDRALVEADGSGFLAALARADLLVPADGYGGARVDPDPAGGTCVYAFTSEQRVTDWAGAARPPCVTTGLADLVRDRGGHRLRLNPGTGLAVTFDRLADLAAPG